MPQPPLLDQCVKDPYDTRFPFGFFAQPTSLRESCTMNGIALEHHLPDVLPIHHPLLHSLGCALPFEDRLPPWWTDALETVDPALRPILDTITLEEFRGGIIEDQRWRLWRASHPDPTMLPHSPKILPMLPPPWHRLFENRGGKQTSSHLELTISSAPHHLLFMANGNGWQSCLHPVFGEHRHSLIGALYETGLAVATLRPRGTRLWGGCKQVKEGVLLARTTVRVVFDDQGALIAIGRCYANNDTCAANLLVEIIECCERQKLRWGIIKYSSLLTFMRSGVLGKYSYQSEKETTVSAQSVPIWLPHGQQRPYIDGRIQWNTPFPQWHTLSAEVVRSPTLESRR